MANRDVRTRLEYNPEQALNDDTDTDNNGGDSNLDKKTMRKTVTNNNDSAQRPQQRGW
eukprot:CAMPEP_0206603646 /NCGR_PEP_ID=MMETSP0325_2-20121206/48649_1 /ASSEMBLY_ACC=CAM_ASM_000347 /TAXON_ID=2866 /ORGANISM="Crypthecodinium cohnii, Strain Seligo" /LENGTH=57 /DNA_ID=CAMNT_0054117449 /DNA_START=1 /DNA_END=174 /DNA_ORIENTATION=+